MLLFLPSFSFLQNDMRGISSPFLSPTNYLPPCLLSPPWYAACKLSQKGIFPPLNCFLSSIWSCQPEKSTNTGKPSVSLCCVKPGTLNQVWAFEWWERITLHQNIINLCSSSQRRIGTELLENFSLWVWETEMVSSAFCLTFWAIANQPCAVLSHYR